MGGPTQIGDPTQASGMQTLITTVGRAAIDGQVRKRGHARMCGRPHMGMCIRQAADGHLHRAAPAAATASVLTSASVAPPSATMVTASAAPPASLVAAPAATVMHVGPSAEKPRVFEAGALVAAAPAVPSSAGAMCHVIPAPEPKPQFMH